MSGLVAEEGARAAVVGCTRWGTRSGLCSETLLADISTVSDSKVAERAVVRMVGRTMSVDEDLVALVDGTLVSLDWTGVYSFTLGISARIRATGSRRGRDWTVRSGTRCCWSNADGFGWDSSGSCCSGGVFNSSRQELRLVLSVA